MSVSSGRAPGESGARTSPVVMLGISQMVAWGSSFFLPAILAVPMARELGLAPSRLALLRGATSREKLLRISP